MGVRDSLELLSRSRAQEVAGTGGTAVYLSSDRSDTMLFASKTTMQHVSKPNGLMHARLQAGVGAVLSLARTAKRCSRGW